jgi:hypothetical protein
MADGERICALEARVSQLEAAFARALGAAGAVRAAGPAEPAAQDAPPPAAVLLSAPPGPPSRVAAEFPPAALAEFRGRAFALLWRGSRDGFLAGAFHRRCDGRAPTLTLIRDAGGCIFGGFTPVRWESRWGARWGPCFKADPSLASFIFSLRGPRGAQPKRFPLRARRMGEAIGCNYRWGRTSPTSASANTATPAGTAASPSARQDWFVPSGQTAPILSVSAEICFGFWSDISPHITPLEFVKHVKRTFVVKSFTGAPVFIGYYLAERGLDKAVTFKRAELAQPIMVSNMFEEDIAYSQYPSQDRVVVPALSTHIFAWENPGVLTFITIHIFGREIGVSGDLSAEKVEMIGDRTVYIFFQLTNGRRSGPINYRE